MSISKDWPRNRLLLALPASNLERLASKFEKISCQSGQVLLDADSSLDDVFFPDVGVVSVVAVYSDGSTIEMATVGERVVRVSKPSSAQRSLPYDFSFKSREPPQRCRAQCSPTP
jgi:hypothetical protein